MHSSTRHSSEKKDGTNAFRLSLQLHVFHTGVCHFGNRLSDFWRQFSVGYKEHALLFRQNLCLFVLVEELGERDAHGVADRFKVGDRGDNAPRKGIGKRALVETGKLRKAIDAQIARKAKLIEFFDDIRHGSLPISVYYKFKQSL